MDRIKYHTIKQGEDLWKVAISYGVTIGRIIELNTTKEFREGNRIRVN